jgi:UDP-glucose 4-epimerase
VTVLVTGGAGYIGSHTVRALRRAGRDVVVLDSLERGNREAVLDTPLVIGNIAEGDLVRSTCAKFDVDAVIHFAAYKSVGESMSHLGAYFHNNVDATVSLLEALATANVDRVVFSSSCSVYGTPAIVPVTETAPIQPESVYAETKAMVERMLRWYSEVSDLRSVSLRYFNAAGASFDSVIGEDWDAAINLIPMVMKAVLGFRPPVQIFGSDYPTPDGTAIRDYIHVDDLAEAHIKALDYLAGGGATRALNVGTGVGSSVNDVIKATQAITGKTVPVEYVARRAGDPVSTYANADLVTSTLDWTPRYGLDQVIETAWNWHSTHPYGYKQAPTNG